MKRYTYRVSFVVSFSMYYYESKRSLGFVFRTYRVKIDITDPSLRVDRTRTSAFVVVRRASFSCERRKLAHCRPRLAMSPPDASADASGSSSDDEAAYVPYARRPEWADVTPLAQPEPARPVVAIDYPPEYVDAHDYFRAVHASGEVSRRALDLTAECLRMNGANYTVWHRRWALVEALAAAEAETKASYVSPAIDGDDGEDHREHPAPSLVDLEFAYATAMALENPKNYQVWNHMRLVSQHLGDVSVERNVRATGEALALDAKNIHAWTHRLWVVRTFPKMMRDAERAFTEKMIDDDVRNNSAWNQRFAVTFLTSSSDDDVIDEDTDFVSKELAFAETKIAIAPDNESAWNYLRGVADLPAARGDDAIKTRIENVARTFFAATPFPNRAMIRKKKTVSFRVWTRPRRRKEESRAIRARRRERRPQERRKNRARKIFLGTRRLCSPTFWRLRARARTRRRCMAD